MRLQRKQPYRHLDLRLQPSEQVVPEEDVALDRAVNLGSLPRAEWSSNQTVFSNFLSNFLIHFEIIFSIQKFGKSNLKSRISSFSQKYDHSGSPGPPSHVAPIH